MARVLAQHLRCIVGWIDRERDQGGRQTRACSSFCSRAIVVDSAGQRPVQRVKMKSATQIWPERSTIGDSLARALRQAEAWDLSRDGEVGRGRSRLDKGPDPSPENEENDDNEANPDQPLRGLLSPGYPTIGRDPVIDVSCFGFRSNFLTLTESPCGRDGNRSPHPGL